MPNLKSTNLFNAFPTVSAFSISALILSGALSGIVHAEEEAAPTKPIVKDLSKETIPDKMKSADGGDSMPKPKSKSSSSSGAEQRAKDELNAEELAGKIAKKMAELRLDSEKSKAQLEARRLETKKVAVSKPKPSMPHDIAVENIPNLRNVHWGYDGQGGPQNWAKIDPTNAKCSTGERQSPINITEGIQVNLDPVTFDYKPVRYNVIDTGQTIQVNVGSGNSIYILGRRYNMVEFHFHKPSEERINGKSYDMVAHLVHKDMDGKIVEIAVLFEEGKANNLIQTIWNNMPLEKNMTVAPTGTIDMNQLLPVDRQYYTYMGSLTTPPCTEGVLWVVYKQPVQLTQEQIAIFHRMYPMNARPIQNTAGRLIKESE